MEQTYDNHVMTEINALKDKNVFLENQISRNIPFSWEDFEQTPSVKYLINHYIKHKLSLFWKPNLTTYVLIHGTLETIKYILDIIVSNNLL